MYNNDYMYAIERNEEYLAHYGIRGMKWGVRKAIASGNSARLGRQYAKAQKKLAKLEKQAGKSKKYARRAALMGAGAAAAGGLAAAGTHGVGNAINYTGKIGRKLTGAYGNAASAIGKGIAGASYRLPIGTKAKLAVKQAGLSVQGSGNAAKRLAKGTQINQTFNNVGEGLKRWGNSRSIGQGIQNTAGKYAGKLGAGKGAAFNTVASQNARKATKGIAGLSNNTIARIGAGAIGAGLAAGAARNAYKAATAQKKAEKFRVAMNESFKGTKYANGGNNGSSKPRQGKKRRR